MVENEKIADLTKLLLKEIGENPNREGLIKTPSRVSKAWSFFSRGYNQNVDEIINGAIFNENANKLNFYSQQIVNGKSIKMVEEEIKNSDESKKLPYWQDD